MKSLLYIAAGGFELLIWLVIFLFYGLAQLGKKRAKKRPGAKPPPRPQRTPGVDPVSPKEELREFLESLSREQEKAAPRPPPRPPARKVVPAQPAHAQKRVKPVSFPPPPKTAPLALSDLMEVETRIEQKPKPAPVRKPPSPREARPATSNFEDVRDVTHATVSPGAFLVGFSGLNMPILSVPLVTPHARHRSALSKDFSQRGALRRAIIGRVLLGPPKGISPEEYNLITGMM